MVLSVVLSEYHGREVLPLASVTVTRAFHVPSLNVSVPVRCFDTANLPSCD